MFLQSVERRLKATLPDNFTLDVRSLYSLKMGLLRTSGPQGRDNFLLKGVVSEKMLSASQRDGKAKDLSNKAKATRCATG
jgi:hypothetical protein